MSKLFIIVLALSIPLFSCASSKIQQPVNNIDTISEEEYEVISTVLNYAEFDKVHTWHTPEPIFNIYQQTYLHHRLKSESGVIIENKEILLSRIERNSNTKLDISLLEDFSQKNKKAYMWENKFSLSKHFVLVPETQEPRIEISRVGFNSDHTQAILYYGRQASLAGNGIIVLLLKENNKWTIRYIFDVWVS